MPHPSAPQHGPIARGAREENTLVPAEDAMLALLRLQQRIVDLERENDFLRGCIPAFVATAPQALAVT